MIMEVGSWKLEVRSWKLEVGQETIILEICESLNLLIDTSYF